jgi:energy-converting hydrogenase Eha subunit E
MRHKHAPILLVGYFLSLSLVMVMAGIAGPAITPAFADSPALVRIIHAAPAVGTADIFLDGQKILSDFGFGTVTGYVSIPPGPHKVPNLSRVSGHALRDGGCRTSDPSRGRLGRSDKVAS